MASKEERADIAAEITNSCGTNTYSLSEKIRSNKEIANFIECVFDNKKNSQVLRDGNIQIRYFENAEDAGNFLSFLDDKKWQTLRFTPSQYDNEFHRQYYRADCMTSHEVIGQEFDNVSVAIDQHFTYDIDGKLAHKGYAFYLSRKMLFQNMTRARKRLLVVIIKNEELLQRCMSIT